jgi:hypothetical protein
MLTYNYDLDDFGSVAGGLAAGVIVIIGIVFLIALAVVVVSIIGQWKMFTKAGKLGWAAIIPYYSQWVACRIAGISSWWVVLVAACTFLGNVIPFVGWIVSLAGAIGAIYMAIVLAVSTARAYGQSDAFAVGYILAGPIFYCITGFGKAKFVGNSNPMNDPIGKKVDEFLVNHNFPSGIESIDAK